MSSELDTLRSLLRKFFRLVADSTKNLYAVYDGFSKQAEKEFKGIF